VSNIPEDLDNGEGRELVYAITSIVRAADELLEKEGGGTRHWVRDYFLPLLREAEYSLVKETDEL